LPGSYALRIVRGKHFLQPTSLCIALGLCLALSL
jgi:hypothetical protein